jgi:ABC-type Na+ transport system ATPase subunit NatA
MDHVARLCSHVAIINEGELVANGALESLQAEHGQYRLEDVYLKLTARPPQE